MKSNRHVQQEMALLPDNAIIKPFAKEIEALVAKFNISGQSGGSAPYTAGALSQAIEKTLSATSTRIYRG